MYLLDIRLVFLNIVYTASRISWIRMISAISEKGGQLL